MTPCKLLDRSSSVCSSTLTSYRSQIPELSPGHSRSPKRGVAGAAVAHLSGPYDRTPAGFILLWSSKVCCCRPAECLWHFPPCTIPCLLLSFTNEIKRQRLHWSWPVTYNLFFTCYRAITFFKKWPSFHISPFLFFSWPQSGLFWWNGDLFLSQAS